ncbi:MAG TPA: polysaccharide biosynthesis/export family protein [Polyangia bacterium]|nr:polysaccharide biosynthesis/export family protein [Polyangia bacterium]
MRYGAKRWLLAVAALGAFAGAACVPATRTVPEAPVALPAVDTSLGVGDSFEVRVFGEPDLTGVYRVGAEGNITFPLIGDVHVDGLDAQAAARLIASKLKQGMLRDPQVTVLVKEQTSKKIYVLGQVGKPGTFTYTPSMSVVEAITIAGGFSPLAAKNDTTLTRNESGKKTTLRVPVADIGEGRARNVYLQPGDIISVPERLF